MGAPRYISRRKTYNVRRAPYKKRKRAARNPQQLKGCFSFKYAPARFERIYFSREGLCLFESLEFVMRELKKQPAKKNLKFYKTANPFKRLLYRSVWLSYLANMDPEIQTFLVEGDVCASVAYYCRKYHARVGVVSVEEMKSAQFSVE